MFEQPLLIYVLQKHILSTSFLIAVQRMHEESLFLRNVSTHLKQTCKFDNVCNDSIIANTAIRSWCWRTSSGCVSGLNLIREVWSLGSKTNFKSLLQVAETDWTHTPLSTPLSLPTARPPVWAFLLIFLFIIQLHRKSLLLPPKKTRTQKKEQVYFSRLQLPHPHPSKIEIKKMKKSHASNVPLYCFCIFDEFVCCGNY